MLAAGHGYAFVEFARRHGDFAIVSAAVLIEEDNNGKVTRASVTLGGMGPAPVRAREVERALIGEIIEEKRLREICEVLRKLDAIEDIHAPASYRQQLATVLPRRALLKAHERIAKGWTHEEDWAMSETRKIAVTVNGTRYEETVPVRVTLADFLRHQLGLTGTHLGCEHGVCGACTILLDGRSARSCLMLAVQADGHEILTVEGIAPSADDAASAAGGVPRQSRPAVRLLHAGHFDDADRISARQSRSDRRRSPHRHFRQSVPLHRLPEHRHRRAGCGEAA